LKKKKEKKKEKKNVKNNNNLLKNKGINLIRYNMSNLLLPVRIITIIKVIKMM